MATFYAMMKCTDPTVRGNRRVNLYFVAELPEDATYGDLNTAAEAECLKRGWSLIVARLVPEDVCLERLAMYAENGEP